MTKRNRTEHKPNKVIEEYREACLRDLDAILARSLQSLNAYSLRSLQRLRELGDSYKRQLRHGRQKI